MKRLGAIASCLLVILAGAASAWASCKQVSFRPNPAASTHAHDHHAASQHSHENRAAIRCPTLDAFLVTATFSSAKNDGVKRLTIADAPELADQFGASHLYCSLHGPPGCSHFSNTPRYLVLSVLRI